MKQPVSDRYTIAWFRLAECVSRGERERALGVYRLLSHSIGNPAFESQLEGDLYLSFGDHGAALTRYQNAVTLYRASGRALEAAAVLEHVATLDPHTYVHHEHMILLYHQLQLSRKVQEHLHRALELLVHGKDRETVEQFLSQLRELSEQYYVDACAYLEQHTYVHNR